MELVIISAIIVILAAIVVPNFLEAQIRSKSGSKQAAQWRALATAIEAYFVDNNAYPAARPLRDFAPDARALRNAGGWELTTVEPGRKGLFGVTTPVAYIKELPTDVFSPTGKLPFAYHPDGTGWILLSPGPNGRYEVDPSLDYDGRTSQPSEQLLQKSYDPSNGVRSSGDIWRTKG